MVAQEFNPIDHAREPREEGWSEETKKIIDHIENRGDQRIGQLLINAVRREIDLPDTPELEKDIEDVTDEEAEQHMKDLKNHRFKTKALIEGKLWSIEADELLKKLDQLKKNEQK